MSKSRVYDAGSAVARNIREDMMLCVVECSDVSGRYWHSWQCQRKRGYGPHGEYCKQHAKMLEQGHKLRVPDSEVC